MTDARTPTPRPPMRRLRPVPAPHPDSAGAAATTRVPAALVPALPVPARAAHAMPPLTPSQGAALDAARVFLGGEGRAFVLSGAAGTGKTTLVQAVAAHAAATGRAVHLVAPTARAARVLRARTGRPTATAHSLLYTVHPYKDRPGFRLERKPNGDSTPTLLVVDEASMVPSRSTTGDDLFHSGSSLLDDLLAHVAAGPPGSQVLFVGDACQLPPVHECASLALSPDALTARYRVPASGAHLTEVVRQAEGSPVMQAAHTLRAALDASADAAADARVAVPPLDLRGFGGAYGAFVRPYLDASDGGRDPDGAVVLACTNNATQRYNRDVRRARGMSGDLAPGDLVLLDADAWRSGDAAASPALRRGETFVVREVGLQVQRVADLRFVRVAVEPVTPRGDGDPGAGAFEGLACLDHLASEKGLSSEQERALHADRLARNVDFRRAAHPRDDAYVGALRLRYAHALTVHKAQGGEWGTVVVDPWVHDNTRGTREHLRWLYTAVTRARNTCLLR